MTRKGRYGLFAVALIVLCFLIVAVPRIQLEGDSTVGEGASQPSSGTDRPSRSIDGLRPGKSHQEPDFPSLRESHAVRLSPDQEEQLKVSNYNAFIRYKAQLEDPTRLKPLPKEQILQERVLPKLRERLEKNREQSSGVTR